MSSLDGLDKGPMACLFRSESVEELASVPCFFLLFQFHADKKENRVTEGQVRTFSRRVDVHEVGVKWELKKKKKKKKKVLFAHTLLQFQVFL